MKKNDFRHRKFFNAEPMSPGRPNGMVHVLIEREVFDVMSPKIEKVLHLNFASGMVLCLLCNSLFQLTYGNLRNF